MKKGKINSMSDLIKEEQLKSYKKTYDNKNTLTEQIDNTNNSLK